MRSLVLCSILVFIASLAAAQLTVTSSTPSDGTTGVPTTTTLSFTFSAPIDTTRGFGADVGAISNIDTITAQWYSADRRTTYLNVRLASNTAYFICIYWAPGDGGANIAIPQPFSFTTGSSFPSPSYQVSGTVSGGTTGISPSYSLVVFSASSITTGKPRLLFGQVADVNGDFVFPGVPPGTYYAVAIKDINQDGQLDPGKGDPVAFADPFTLVAAPVSGIHLVFTSLEPPTYTEACDSIGAVPPSSIPADKVLRMVNAWDMDSTGRVSDWSFYYSSPSTGKYFSALPESIIVRTENAGGRTWRSFANTGGYIFKISMTLGYLRNSQFSEMSFDTSKIYWGVEYMLGTQPAPDSFATVRTKKFVVDIASGNIVSLTGVVEKTPDLIPASFALTQNYPNPFNPSTTIGFGVSGLGSSWVRLSIFDLLGREVAVLVNGQKEPGDYTVSWNAGGVTSGVYYYRLHVRPLDSAVGRDSKSGAGNFFDVKKMILLK